MFCCNFSFQTCIVFFYVFMNMLVILVWKIIHILIVGRVVLMSSVLAICFFEHVGDFSLENHTYINSW